MRGLRRGHLAGESRAARPVSIPALVEISRNMFPYRVPYPLGCSTRHGALFDDDCTGFRVQGHIFDCSVQSSHVRSSASSHPTRFRWGVDCKEDHVRSGDADLSITCEEEVRPASRDAAFLALIGFIDDCTISCQLDDLIEAGLVDGKMRRVPSFDAALVSIQHLHADFGIMQRDDCSSGPA